MSCPRSRLIPVSAVAVGGTRALDAKRMARTQFLINAAGGASARDERAAAITQLPNEGAVEAIPFLRSRFVADISEEASTAATCALARLGDFESLDAFVRMVLARYGEVREQPDQDERSFQFEVRPGFSGLPEK